MRLNFIRRIVVDNAVSDANGKDRTRIYFELNCPVVIRRGFMPDKKVSNGCCLAVFFIKFIFNVCEANFALICRKAR